MCQSCKPIEHLRNADPLEASVQAGFVFTEALVYPDGTAYNLAEGIVWARGRHLGETSDLEETLN